MLAGITDKIAVDGPLDPDSVHLHVIWLASDVIRRSRFQFHHPVARLLRA